MPRKPEAIGFPARALLSGSLAAKGPCSNQWPDINSVKLHASHTSSPSNVSLQDTFESKQYRRYRFSHGLHPSTKSEAKLTTMNDRRRCASASSPWTISGMHFRRSVSWACLLIQQNIEPSGYKMSQACPVRSQRYRFHWVQAFPIRSQGHPAPKDDMQKRSDHKGTLHPQMKCKKVAGSESTGCCRKNSDGRMVSQNRSMACSSKGFHA